MAIVSPPFVLRPLPHPSRQLCCEVIQTLPDGTVVEFKDEETPSAEQYRLMWPLLRLWEKHQKACVAGQMIPISAEGWKAIHLADFQRDPTATPMWVLTPRGLLMPFDTRTSTMSKKKLALFLTYLLAETSDRGMELPPRHLEECQGYIKKYRG